MKFHKKKDDAKENKKYRQNRSIKEKAKTILKYVGTGAAVIIGGATAVILAGLASTTSSDDDSNSNDRYYEPFADPNNPLYIETDSYGEINWDEDVDQADESYGAEDYYSGRPWTDE